MTDHVEIHDVDGVRRVRLNRPGKANALSINMLHALRAAFTVPAGSGLRAIHVSSAGRDFCGGGDLSELRSGRQEEQYETFCALVEALSQRTLPLITEVHGTALGAAFLFPVLSDVVLAADTAVFGIPELKFGMYPALVHQVLIERLPYPLVFQLCIGARSLPAAEALSLGLVTELILADDFVSAAAARTEYYLQRIDAIEAGRALRLPEYQGDLATRARRSAAALDRNLTAPAAQRLLAAWTR